MRITELSGSVLAAFPQEKELRILRHQQVFRGHAAFPCIQITLCHSCPRICLSLTRWMVLTVNHVILPEA